MQKCVGCLFRLRRITTLKSFEDYDFDSFDYSKKYHLHIDFDTPIFANAAASSKDVCVVTLKKNGKKKVFDNFDEFYKTFEEKYSKTYKLWDFDIPLIAFAITGVNNQLNEMVSKSWVGDYTLYIGGKKNFRKDLYPEYKGNRQKSPAMRQVLVDYVLHKYADKVKQADNEEAEDHCLSEVLKDIDNNVVGYVDKDLTTQSAYFFNYKKQDKGVFFINEDQAFFNLCCQILHGDSTDNIFGINFITNELRQAFQIKTKSIGAATAERLLNDVQHDKQKMKERICEVYKLSYGKYWKERLQFTGSLVFISKRPKEYFDVDKFMRGIEVEY